MKASIQIKNGIYQVVISYKDFYGKNRVKWVSTGLKEGTGKRKLEETRREILTKFEEDYNRKLYAFPHRPLTKEVPRYEFTAFMEMWLEMVKPSLAHTTYIGYAKNIRRIKAYFCSSKIMLEDLKPFHIQNFYNQLSAEGLSGNTIKHIHVNIRKALKYAVKTELIPYNPADRTDRPKCEKYNASFYNKEELMELFRVFEGDRMELCVHIVAYYGLRRSEVVGLKWDAVDFQKKTITIRHKVISSYGEGTEKIIGEDKLKNLASHRTLPLIPHIEKLLLEERSKQEYYMELLRDGYNRDYLEYICRDNLGNLITPGYISDHFHFIVKKHGLKHLRFHDLRHSCASLLVANGISMKQIQEWLGHSTYNVTANFYSHLDYNSKVESAEMIAHLLDNE